MPYGDNKPDYEDEQVRFWKEPLSAKEKYDEDKDSKSVIRIDMGDGHEFLFYASWIIYADKEHTRPIFAFKAKYEEEMVLWVEIPENVKSMEDEKLMEKAKTKVLNIWKTLGYSDRDAREVLEHVKKLAKRGEFKDGC